MVSYKLQANSYFGQLFKFCVFILKFACPELVEGHFAICTLHFDLEGFSCGDTMEQGQVDQVKTNDLSKKIQRLLDQESLVGAVIILRMLQPDDAKKVLEQLSPADRERIYDASFAWEDKTVVERSNVVSLEQTNQNQEEQEEEAKQVLPFFPDQIISLLATAGLITSLILILTIFSPARLGVKADVLNTAMNVKPEWYFLFLYSLFSLVPSILGVVAPLVALVLLALLPFLDKNIEVRAEKRKFAIVACLVLVAVLIILSVLGAYYI